MQVEVVDGLASAGAVVYGDTKALAEALVLGHLLGGVEQVPEDLFVALVRLGQPREPRAVLGDHEEVRRRLGRNVPERQALVVLVNHVGGDLLADDFVEDGGPVAVGGGAAALAALSSPPPMVPQALTPGPRSGWLLLLKDAARGAKRTRTPGLAPATDATDATPLRASPTLTFTFAFAASPTREQIVRAEVTNIEVGC
eukprot:CAMPEP_0197486378 /NCGR_PEP_ID=MMETSP1311-20131121/1306_1 /TAXON_ID=464262 /ORGANISM="Genus nov. species nov., Strain RCC856" /LENGTH=198 /DNA_ID=CAMNT_0043029435 /DNA_START=379 /DNA_END=973 /DNA_ORIENTATION=-